MLWMAIAGEAVDNGMRRESFQKVGKQSNVFFKAKGLPLTLLILLCKRRFFHGNERVNLYPLDCKCCKHFGRLHHIFFRFSRKAQNDMHA